jgi:hypothetical protein
MAGYLGGIAIALKHSEKSKAKFADEVAEKGCAKKALWDNIVDIHRSMANSMKDWLTSEENVKRYETLRTKVMDEIEIFKTEAEIKIEDLKKKGYMKKDEIEAELKRLYDNRSALIKKAKSAGIEAIESMKDSGKEVWELAEVKLNKIYADLKAKISK